MFPTNDELFNLMILKGATGGAVVEATATGNPLAFITDKAKPLKSLLIPFTPQQEGSGDPSPENIRPILPWDGLMVFGGGRNLLNPATIRKQGTDNLWWYEQGGLFLHAGTYCFTFARNMTGFYVIDANTGTNLRSRYNSATDKFTLTEDHFIKINVYVSGGVDIDEEAMLEAGSTATSYEPYHPITETDIVFPSAVYGGTLDVVSGVLTVEWADITAKWSEFKNKNEMDSCTRGSYVLTSPATTGGASAICNIAKRKWNYSEDSVHFYADGAYAYVFLPNGTDGNTEIQIAYPLATPQTIQLTPAQITALIGNNTIWSDADGEMTAVYLKKK